MPYTKLYIRKIVHILFNQSFQFILYKSDIYFICLFRSLINTKLVSAHRDLSPIHEDNNINNCNYIDLSKYFVV